MLDLVYVELLIKLNKVINKKTKQNNITRVGSISFDETVFLVKYHVINSF